MLFVHEMVAQSGSTTGDAAIGEEDVDLAKPRRDAVEKQTVTEADGRVPSIQSEQ